MFDRNYYRPTATVRANGLAVGWASILKQNPSAKALFLLSNSGILGYGQEVFESQEGVHLDFQPSSETQKLYQQTQQIVPVIQMMDSQRFCMVYLVNPLGVVQVAPSDQRPDLDLAYYRLCRDVPSFLGEQGYMSFKAGLAVSIRWEQLPPLYMNLVDDPDNLSRLAWVNVKYGPHGRTDFEASLEAGKIVQAVWTVGERRLPGIARVLEVGLDSVTIQVTAVLLAFDGSVPLKLTLPLSNHPEWDAFNTVWPALPAKYTLPD